MKPSIQYWEQSINNIILLKQYVKSIPSVFEALATARGDLLVNIREVHCSNRHHNPGTDSGIAVHPRDGSRC